MSNKPGTPKEGDLENYIVDYLTAQPKTKVDGCPLPEKQYHEVDAKLYDKDYCLIKEEVVAFLKESQPEEWDKFINVKGEEAALKSLFTRIEKEISAYGTLDLLKSNVGLDAGMGSNFKMLYFKPVSDKNKEHEALYLKNRLAVMHQFKYSNDEGQLAIDLAIFLNGLPIATIELKNTLTGQKHMNAVKQYKGRKIAGEKSLEFKRILVHFACGTEQVYMTTRLNEDKTRFFPFNETLRNEPDADSEKGKETKAYRTSYLWEDVLSMDSILNLIQNYITVQTDEKTEYDPKVNEVKTTTSESLIFPRFHQRRAVEKLVEAQKEKGAGHCYLIQHSAGSGKSNTITWLAFRLSSFYRNYNDKKTLYDTVFVVTDRLVLNSQIANNIRQFQVRPEQVAYVVDSADGKQKKSAQDLKKAIEDHKRIIVTNIQKFPVISDLVAHETDRNFAVIIDEAHSSQSGNFAKEMRKALSLEEAEDFDEKMEKDYDEERLLNAAIELDMKRTGRKKNISYFAFTATPKPKTIQLFCELKDGRRDPFDKYTMKQAIEEGFIMDVLKNYTTFKRYYKLSTTNGSIDNLYEKKKTIRLLSDFVDLQDAAIEKKSRIMLDHFVARTQYEINGEARAMLVTRSRLHAVRYKLKFDSIMKEMHLPYKALVAFSGTVTDPDTGLEYTEKSMNGIGNAAIPRALKHPKFRILIVAMKYQTGFDEPNLHTMFVDKKLGDTSTVQTLSRLNRTRSGKTSTMVLDFVNDAEAVKTDFQDFFESSYMLQEDETDSNLLYDLKSKLYHYGAFDEDDVHSFSHYYYGDEKEKHKVNGLLDNIADRCVELGKEVAYEIRSNCKYFSNVYNFLSQIIEFDDKKLHELAPFCLALSKKLPSEEESLPYEVLEDTELDSYSIRKTGQQDLSLAPGETAVKGQSGTKAFTPTEDELDFLSNIIKMLNETYGLDLTDDDKKELDRMRQEIEDDENLSSYFNEDNARADIRKLFDEKVDDQLLSFITSKLDLYNKLSEDRANNLFKSLFFNELYDRRVKGLI